MTSPNSRQGKNGAGRVNRPTKSFYVAILYQFVMRLLCGWENTEEYVKEK